MRRHFGWFICGLGYLTITQPVWAQTPNPVVTAYAQTTMNIIVPIATAAAVFFLVKGGYSYITSEGDPKQLDQAKLTIRNALLGLVLVLGSSVLVSVFRGALIAPTQHGTVAALPLTPIMPETPSNGLTQLLIDAVNGFMQTILESATKPIMDGLFSFLTTTPSLLSNTVVFNFWLVSLGIVDSLFVIVVALLGLRLMSAATFGFEEVSLSQLLPKIGIAFLGANISLFLADYVIQTTNALINGVLLTTGGLNHAWITNAVNLEALASQQAPLIILIFMVILLIVSIVLLLMYISRLIVLALGAVLSPFIFLLMLLPKFSDMAEIAAKSYIVTALMMFVHVVIIQLAASFLSLPDNSNNSLISIAVAIGLFMTLLKSPAIMLQMVLYTSNNLAIKRIAGQMMNSAQPTKSASKSRHTAAYTRTLKTPRKVITP
jgi:hypothetical protein